MNAITLESYLIRDDRSICNEIYQIATEGISASGMGSIAQGYVDRIRTAADSLMKNKNPKVQKGMLENIKGNVAQFKNDVKAKKIPPAEAKSAILVILGIIATILAGVGAVKIAAKIKNAINKDDPKSLETAVKEEMASSNIATEGMVESIAMVPAGILAEFFANHKGIGALILIFSMYLLPVILVLATLWGAINTVVGIGPLIY